MDTTPEKTAKAIRTRRIEAAALAVLAILPLVPHLTFLLRSGVPRFGLIGDLALLEQATRHVWGGDTLLGPRSRFDWNHPGPLFFFLAAPFQAIFGSASTGLYVATCMVNASAAGAIATCARLFARRPHAVATLLVVLLWFAAFGNVAADPWSPMVVVLPLMAHLLNAAMLARGKSAALFPMVLFGALASQTHVATASTVLVISFGCVVAFYIGARRRGGLQSSEEWRLAIAAAVTFIFLIPPIIEQGLSAHGNIRKVYSFFIHRSAPLKSLTSAMIDWMTATAWLPERIAKRALFWEQTPAMTRSSVESPYAKAVTLAHLVGVALAGLIAAKRKDLVSLSLLAIGAVADALAVMALQAVVGPTYPYLIFWTTAASSVAWIGVFSTFFSIISAWTTRISGHIAPVIIVLGLGLAVASATMQRGWLSRHPLPAESHPELRTDLRSITTGLEQRLRSSDTTAIVHREGAKEIADAVVLELEKDGFEPRVTTSDHDTYVGVRTGNAVTKPLHVWFGMGSTQAKNAKCLEVIAKSGELSILGSPKEQCP